MSEALIELNLILPEHAQLEKLTQLLQSARADSSMITHWLPEILEQSGMLDTDIIIQQRSPRLHHGPLLAIKINYFEYRC